MGTQHLHIHAASLSVNATRSLLGMPHLAPRGVVTAQSASVKEDDATPHCELPPLLLHHPALCCCCCLQVLQPPHGVAYVAAKSFYFGVGGSTTSFADLVKGDGILECTQVCVCVWLSNA